MVANAHLTTHLLHHNPRTPTKQTHDSTTTGRYGYLVWLAVSTKAQGLGVGKKLLHAFEEAMKEEGCRILLIDTQSDNIAARSFFAKAGFKGFEDHRYYTKSLPSALEEEAAAAAERQQRQEEVVPLEVIPSPVGSKEGAKPSSGVPQPRLMRLTTGKKASKVATNV